ncbi:MAG: crotonase/enoyl-CoA hydratase family protein [Acidobacteria bacterium]|nr:MAG: crotonase/enoyl-CoA hydratase family protein [Acidobacteriota bacterium]REK05960.1 MAG: crotonase/enoyl-CoA hydratase family protein [Acidobacteriota bacterium]
MQVGGGGSETTVRVERDGPITTVILDRPEVRNAVDNPTAERLAAAFREFDADDEAQVAVFHGAHGHFCAGADLKAVARGERTRRYDAARAREGDGPMGPTRLELSKPVIAAVSGYAVAGGLELALWCDLRVVEESAVFGVYCRRWGVPLIDGGTVRLPRLIGLSRALDLILTGRSLGAREAERIGLANRVVPDGAARQAATELARELVRFPQLCLRTDRASAYAAFEGSVGEAMQREFLAALEVLEKETVAGAKRFAEGRGRGGSFDDL